MGLFSFGLFIIGFQKTVADIAATFGLNESQKADLNFCFYLSFTGCLLLSSYLSEKVSKRSLVLFGYIVYTLSVTLLGVSASLPRGYFFAITALFGAGFGCGIMQGCASSLLSEMYPSESAKYLNISQAFFAVAAIAGPSYASLMVSFGGWGLNYTSLGAFGVLGIVLTTLGRVPHNEQKGTFSFISLFSYLRDGRFVLIYLCLVFYVAAEVGPCTFMDSYLRARFDKTQGQTAFIVTLFWIGMAAGRAVYIPSVKRFGDNAPVFVSCVMGTITILIFTLTDNFPVAAACVGIYGLSISGMFPTLFAQIPRHFPKNVGAAMNLAASAGGIGAALGPKIIGAAADSPVISLRYSFLCAVGFLSAVAICLTALRKTAGKQ